MRRPSRVKPWLLGAALLGPSGIVAADRPRFPRWPTEVDRIAGPLYSRGSDRPASERMRADALLALDAYATEVIEGPLLWALDDPSLQVRREALRLCFERAVTSCIDGAATLYNDGLEPSLRIAALRVLALDPNPRSASILIAALRDGSESIRSQAAEFVGTAPLDATMHGKARAALLAKLPDVSAVVRRAAVTSLGLLGPGDGALAIARVLDDPEPTVRAAAADALRRMRDDRVVPALRRAVQAPNEPVVAKALVEALAVLETADGEQDLLALIDDPPQGLNTYQIATAVARRPEPSATLITGLIERLREPPLAPACLNALLILGPRARAGIQAALDRGVEAPIAVELSRLVAALDPPTKALAHQPWPAPPDQARWKARVSGPGASERVEAGLALGQRAPAWFGDAAAAWLSDATLPSQRRGWLVALARATGPLELGAAGPRAVARVSQWAQDPTIGSDDRCLAVLALGTVGSPDARGSTARRAQAAVRDATADRDPVVRACAAAAAPSAGLTTDVRVEGLLADPDPRVRTLAVLAVGTLAPDDRSKAMRSRVAVLQHHDPSGPVREAAQFIRAQPPQSRDGAPQAAVAAGLYLGPTASPGVVSPWLVHPTDDGLPSLSLPALGAGATRWVVVPGQPDAAPKSSKYSLPTDIER